MFLYIVLPIAVSLLGGATVLAISSPQKYLKIFLYLYIINISLAASMLCWNLGIADFINYYAGNGGGEINGLKDFASYIQLPVIYFLIPLVIFLWLLGLSYLAKSLARTISK
ncbi:MAG: hypothetical protein HZB59_00765 [Ignavibacteriales bacterium]|nr:hypothetical protein [Ignavibacteriales bacterium]